MDNTYFISSMIYVGDETFSSSCHQIPNPESKNPDFFLQEICSCFDLLNPAQWYFGMKLESFYFTIFFYLEAF